MDVTKFTATEIMECAAIANAATGSSSPPSDADYGRAFDSICAAGVVGMSAWGVQVRAHAREILLRKQAKAGVSIKVGAPSCDAMTEAAERALAPWRDVGRMRHAAREALARDRAAEDIARAMQGLPPIKVEIVNEPARLRFEEVSNFMKVLGPEFAGFEVKVGVDHQGPVDPAVVAAYEDLLRGLGAGTPIPLPAKPDPTTAPLDAMLRLLCGHPQGPRWIGERLYLEVQRIARKFRPDAQVEHRYTAGMAASLLGVCEQFDPGSTARFLDRQEQQEYLRLFDALRVAVNAVPASGVR